MDHAERPEPSEQTTEAQPELTHGIVPVAKDLVKEISADDVPGLAAEVAYHAIFSIPAILVVFATLAALINNVAEYDLERRLNDIINDSAPASSRPMLKGLVENAVAQVDGGTASIGLAGALLVALWAGSNALGVLVKAFNRAYDVTEERSFPRMKLAAVLLTITMGLVVNLALALWVFGGQIGSWLAREFAMGATFDWVWNLARIPLGVIVLASMLAMLYYVGPIAKKEFRWVLPGAAFSTVVWGLLVLGFSIYLRFASPGSAYGLLSGLIVFLFFLYLTALIFLVGAELNAVLARRYDPRYRAAIRAGDVAAQVVRRSPANLPVHRSSAGGLAVGVVATVGIVLASMLGRRDN